MQQRNETPKFDNFHEMIHYCANLNNGESQESNASHREEKTPTPARHSDNEHSLYNGTIPTPPFDSMLDLFQYGHLYARNNSPSQESNASHTEEKTAATTQQPTASRYPIITEEATLQSNSTIAPINHQGAEITDIQPLCVESSTAICNATTQTM